MSDIGSVEVLGSGRVAMLDEGSAVLENGLNCWSLLERISPGVSDVTFVAMPLEVEGLRVSDGVLEEDTVGMIICEVVIVVKSVLQHGIRKRGGGEGEGGRRRRRKSKKGVIV